MELQTTSRRIGLAETLFDDFDERPVDCDFVLPDFLPDIAAILKCMIRPVVQSHQITGDRVMADGTVYIQVLYLDEERKCVRSFESTQPFTSVFSVKNLQNHNTVSFSTKVNYVNCRATGPRRVDIHGAFSVKLTVMGQQEIELIESACADNLYTKGCTVTCTVPSGNVEKSFTVNEVLELNGAQPAHMLLRHEAHICLTDCKQLPGKAVVKGDILLKVVYVTDPESGAVGHQKYTIPFSQILDVDGLTEDTLCDCHADILAADVRLSQNPNGENRLITVSMKAALGMDCFRDETGDMMTDVFHTVYPLSVSTCRIAPCRITDIRREILTIQQSVELSNGGVSEILDVWAEPLSAACENTDGGASITGQMLLHLLVRDENGMVCYEEKTEPFTLPQDGECSAADVTVLPLDTEYTMAGGRLDVRVKVCVCRRICLTDSRLAVTALQADESAPFPCAEGMEKCQLKVCFAEAGQSVWEIAKAEHASPDALKAENELTDDYLSERTMLLIPLR